jgi:hypothetical protein
VDVTNNRFCPGTLNVNGNCGAVSEKIAWIFSGAGDFFDFCLILI